MSRFLWTKKQNSGPKPRLAHSMAFDSNRERVILFGGDSLRSQLCNDTWEWDGEHWTQVADIGPSPRSGHAMAHDSARHRIVLFGGSAGAENRGDTWEWSGEDWTQVADEGPAARTGHSMAFDAARNRTVLFGGGSTGAGLFRDTWEWDGELWTQAEDTGPSARKSCAVAYDSNRNRVVLLGGDSGEQGLGDTWEWNGATWTHMADFGPEPRLGAAMAFKQDRVALFGGLASSSPPAPAQVFGNTWEWNGSRWTQRQDIGPDPRWGHAMAFDSTRRRLVIFGGLPLAPSSEAGVPDRLLGDTWEHTERESAQPQRPSAPGPSTLESFVITPTQIIEGERATCTLVLSAIPVESRLVLLTATPDVLMFDAPVITGAIEGLGSVTRMAVRFLPGNRNLQFRFRTKGSFVPTQELVSITITATLDDSSLTAPVVVTR